MPDLGPEHQNDAHKDGERAAQVNSSADADSQPVHNPKHVKSLLDGLRGLLGIDHTPVMGELNPEHDQNKADALKEAGIGGALNKGISDGTGASNEY